MAFLPNSKSIGSIQRKCTFLIYVIISQRVKMREQKIETIKNWLEPKFV